MGFSADCPALCWKAGTNAKGALESGRPAREDRGKSSVCFRSSQGREWRKKGLERKKHPTCCLLWKHRNRLKMDFWTFTEMLSVLLVSLTKLLKSSIWPSKDSGSNNLFQTCPKTAFSFACLRSCLPLPTPTGVQARPAQQHEKWELGLKPRSQAHSPRVYKEPTKIISHGWSLHLTP